jgi:hypothetical protein
MDILGKSKAERLEVASVIIGWLLIITAVIGLSIYAEPIQGDFQLVGIAGGAFLCIGVFHYRHRVNKEEKAQISHQSR